VVRSPARLHLDGVLGLGSRAASVSTISVARKLDLLVSGQLQNLLETTANGEENLAALLVGTSLATGNIAIAASRDALSYGARPETDAEECLADVDDHTHDLAVSLVLQGLADGAHHHLEPQVVDVDIAFVLVLVRPLAAMLVLGVLPLRADAGLEEMVVGLECQFRNGSNIVLSRVRCVRHLTFF
jgi:hypothetical protein